MLVAVLPIDLGEQRGLIGIVRAAAKLDVGRRRQSASGVRLHVVILQEAAFCAASLAPDVDVFNSFRNELSALTLRHEPHGVCRAGRRTADELTRSVPSHIGVYRNRQLLFFDLLN